MQVNKKTHPSSGKKRSKHSSSADIDVAEAALKYDASSPEKKKLKKGKNSDNNNNNTNGSTTSNNNNDEDNGNELISNDLLAMNEGKEEKDEANEDSELNSQPDEPAEQLRQYENFRNLENESNNNLVNSQQQILHQSSIKPLAGTDEWHKIRRDNHKEVERRRRDNINAGIKEIASLLPVQDSNKAAILQRAAEFIKRLKDNENNNMEKWTLEKLLSEQNLAELTSANEKLKLELERAYREIEHYKKKLAEK